MRAHALFCAVGRALSSLCEQARYFRIHRQQSARRAAMSFLDTVLQLYAGFGRMRLNENRMLILVFLRAQTPHFSLRSVLDNTLQQLLCPGISNMEG